MTFIYRYTFFDLVADIGGYMGLFLGASFMTLYDWGTGVAERIYRGRKREH